MNTRRPVALPHRFLDSSSAQLRLMALLIQSTQAYQPPREVSPDLETPSVPRAPQPSTPRHSLPPPNFHGDTRSLLELIRSRRSGGISGHRPIGLSDLSTVLSIQETATVDPIAIHPTLRPRIYVLAWNVLSLEPGVYVYEDPGHQLVWVRDATPSTRKVMLQSDQRSAAAVLFLVSPLQAWFTMFGDRGYRAALLSIGWACDRLYLAAERCQLAYSATGGFAPRLADELLGLDGYTSAALFAFVLGSRGV